MKKDDFHVGDKFILTGIGTKRDSTWIITKTNDDRIFYKYYSGELERYGKAREFISEWGIFLTNSDKLIILISDKERKLRVAIDKIKSSL